MYSDRSAFDLEKNELTLAFERLVAEGRRPIDLTASNPTKAGVEYPEREILAAISRPGSLLYSPLPAGLSEARDAVARYYRSRGSDVSSNDILLTASTSEAYAYLFKLLANPGDRILIPQPSYPLFDYLCAMESLETIPYRISYFDGWKIDLEDLKDKLESGARALLLVHPNNPTGSFIHLKEWEEIVECCSLTGVPVICDEVFFDYPFAGRSPLDLSKVEEIPLYLLNGLSKIAGLPQMKLGWVLLRGPDSVKRESLHRLEMIADTYLSVSTPIQHAAQDLLNLAPGIKEQIRQRTGENRAVLDRTLRGSAVSYLDGDGGWYATLRLPAFRSEEEWALLFLETTGVYVHPGYFFGFSDPGTYAVVSLLPSPGDFKSGIEAIAGCVQDFG